MCRKHFAPKGANLHRTASFYKYFAPIGAKMGAAKIMTASYGSPSSLLLLLQVFLPALIFEIFFKPRRFDLLLHLI